MHVLLIEDDERVGSGIRSGLQVAGFTVDWVATAADARLALASAESTNVLLDLGLPIPTGWCCCATGTRGV